MATKSRQGGCSARDPFATKGIAGGSRTDAVEWATAPGVRAVVRGHHGHESNASDGALKLLC
jgi:hypothetical protein